MSDTIPLAYPILYSFRRCPYAMRARIALYAAGITSELREVVLRDKPESMLNASPKGSVPVLVLTDGTVIDESLDIIKYALNYNDPQKMLSCDQNIAEELIAENDSHFKRALDRYKYPNRYPDEDTSGARDQGEVFLDKLNTLLSNQKSYLLGDHASYADISIFPFIRQFANTDRGWFDALPYPYLQTWLDTNINGSLFSAVMFKYDQWKKGDTPIIFGVSP